MARRHGEGEPGDEVADTLVAPAEPGEPEREAPALVEELKDSKVTITNLAPGATNTEFQDRAGIADTLLFAAGVMDAKSVAKAGYQGMLSGTSVVVPGIKNKVGAKTAHLVPRPVIRKLVSKINSKK